MNSGGARSVERHNELRQRAAIDCGLDRIVVNAPLQTGTPEELLLNLHRIAIEVIPVLRDVPAPA
jgi:hypothetical protein